MRALFALNMTRFLWVRLCGGKWDIQAKTVKIRGGQPCENLEQWGQPTGSARVPTSYVEGLGVIEVRSIKS